MPDLSTYSGVMAFIQSTGYFVLFFMMIFEGPIITTIAAFGASLGFFNVYFILGLSLLGNIVGDLIYFSIGKISRKVVIDKYLAKFKVQQSTVEKLEKQLKEHPGKALAIIKLVPPLPTPGLLLAGAVNLNFKTFIFYSILISFSFSLFSTLLGYYTGLAFYNFSQYTKYFELAVAGLIVFSIGGFYTLKRIKKNLQKSQTLDIKTTFNVKDIYFLSGIVFLFLGILMVIRNFFANHYSAFFWFCDIAPFLYAIGLFLKKDQFIKSLINISLIIQTISLVLLSSAVFFGQNFFGFKDIVNYSDFYILVSFLLHFTSIIALILTIKTKPKPKPINLFYSFLILILLFLLTVTFTQKTENINYVYNILGFSFPYYTELWIFLSFIGIVLPTYGLQYLIYITQKVNEPKI